MMKKALLFAVFCFMLAGCNAEANRYKGEEPDDPRLRAAIIAHFEQFNDAEKWGQVTDDFVRQVYALCSSDYSGEKSVAEMKKIFKEINKNSLNLVDFYVDRIAVQNKKVVHIEVTRKWEDSSEDEMAYELILVNDEWRINQRLW
ncbi:hypothetical protein K0T92_20640 [Paenibacillus oenotherae]|uniref:DUF4878 domain-containing protein n=1 Tax=Paenibacillus oenotherae TaxID=1435645 RepID=A0ABS7DB05_9BACL|nr:hypothetical protein [Paenibacillus oenotherae]MBW7477127.1 hypothetical protein [Paenibacillus oenotherae]